VAEDKIIIKFDGDIDDLTKKLKDVDSSIKVVKSSSSGLGSSLSLVAKTASAAFVVLTGAVTTAIAAYKDQEQAEIRTRKTIEATGGAAGVTAEEMFDLAKSMQAVTTFQEEAVLGAQNLLLTFKNIGKDTFPRATEAVLDMATAMDTDLKSAAIQLGKALNDPTQGMAALTRVGVTFSEEQKRQVKALQDSGDIFQAQSLILKELESQFGGVSRAATKGTGSLIQTKNLLGDIVEEIGKAVLPAVEAVNTKLLNTLKRDDNFITSSIKGWGQIIENVFGESAEKSKEELTGIDTELKKIDESIAKFEGKLKSLREKKQSGLSFITFNKDDEERYLKLLADALSERSELLTKQTEIEKSISQQQREQDLASTKKHLDEKSAIIQQAKIDEDAFIEEIEGLKKEKQSERDKEIKERLDAQFDQARAVAQEDIRAALKENQLRLKEEVRYGKDLATLKAKFRTEEYQGVALMFDNLAQLGGTGNKTLGAIAKTAAIARSVMNTAEGVTNALAKVPYPLNFAAAASVGAAGAVQIAKISAQQFARGGMVEGGTIGKDSVPIVAQHGELVAPRHNFDEVIGSVRALREAERIQGGSGGNGMTVELSLKDDLGDFIEAIILERRVLGVGSL